MTRDQSRWLNVAWPSGLLAYQLNSLSRQWDSLFFRILFCITAAWFLAAWLNFLTKGKLTAWMDGEEGPEIPDDFHRFCLQHAVTPALRLHLAVLLEGGAADDEDFKTPASGITIASPADALAVCAAFKQCADPDAKMSIARLFKECGSQEAFRIFYQLAMPLVLQHALALNAKRTTDAVESDLFSVVTTLIAYGHPPSFALIADLAHDPATADSPWWELVFRSINPNDPEITGFIDRLTRHLPDGFAGVAFLDWANQSMLKHHIAKHPFDQAAGRARIETYLTDREPEHASHAVSATAALPFVTAPAGLFALAASHPDRNVKIEAAWAKAKSGDLSGADELAAFCRDWRSCAKAITYLTEIGMESRIPAEALHPRARAIGEMARWLEHPNELAEMPDRLEIVDHREIFWPPAGERIPVTLIRWTLREKSGIGMTGSSTWCFFYQQATPAEPVLAIYARHCAWELAHQAPSDAPAGTEDPDHGRDLLAQHNPDEDWTATG